MAYADQIRRLVSTCGAKREKVQSTVLLIAT